MARIWRKWNLQPWRVQTFKFSTDPELDPKIRDVVGLYLHPPENAVVLCVDEKSQVALDRTAPVLPILPGVANEIPSSAASNRADQCVTPRCSGGRPPSANVATTTSISSISGGRPLRG